MITFLNPLVEKLNQLYSYGLSIVETPAGTIHMHAMLFIVTADLPARADLMNMKNFNGKWACHLCKDMGVAVGTGLHRVWPLDKNNELRTEDD